MFSAAKFKFYSNIYVHNFSKRLNGKINISIVSVYVKIVQVKGIADKKNVNISPFCLVRKQNLAIFVSRKEHL